LKCEYCGVSFFEDNDILEKYLMHLIIIHGDEIQK